MQATSAAGTLPSIFKLQVPLSVVRSMIEGDTPPTPEDRAAVEGNLVKAQDFFKAKGFGPEAGTDKLPAVFIGGTDFDNAAYASDKIEAKLLGGIVSVKMGAEFMAFGKNEATGKAYGLAPDVAVHEYTHRVLSKLGISAAKEGDREVAAVEESLGDTFGAAMEGNYTVGEAVLEGGLRSMEHPDKVFPPGDEPAAAHMDQVREDMHQYQVAGVPNRAATLIGKSVGPEKLGDIYALAVQKYLPVGPNIAALAAGTLSSSTERFGQASPERQAVIDAWKAVGLDPSTLPAAKA